MVLNIPHCGGMLLVGDTPMRKQFVLDKRTDKLLEELASYNGGNRSLIVRQAIQVYSDMEDRLDKIEADSAFQAMMAKSETDIKAGRVTSHEEVVRRSRALSKRRTKKR
jgi:predicted transcriptional regulator